MSDTLPAEQRHGFLDRLGIIGWDYLEAPIGAFLLLGGAILLCGPHGIAKSRLARKLAEALGEPFARYDASMNVWEDIIGFPDPAKLMDPSLRDHATGIPRIETRTSVWGKRFLLVDEINRCSPEMQSKWLEIILERSLMGEPTGAVWIVSAMNPGYSGTYPLNLALASRYLMFMPVPTSESMTPAQLYSILSLDNPEEAPAICKTGTPAATDKQLLALLSEAAQRLPEATPIYSEVLDRYVVGITATLCREAGIHTDMRRMRMMKSVLLATIAFQSVLDDVPVHLLPQGVVSELARTVVSLSYPTIAGLDGPTLPQVAAAHLVESPLLAGLDTPFRKALHSKSALEAFRELLSGPCNQFTIGVVAEKLLGTDERFLVAAALFVVAQKRQDLIGPRTMTLVTDMLSDTILEPQSGFLPKAAPIGQPPDKTFGAYAFCKERPYVEVLADWAALCARSLQGLPDIPFVELEEYLAQKREHGVTTIRGIVDAFV